jgi:hypothetical protein
MCSAELSAEQIRGLFNAVAQDRAGKTMGVVDSDLAEIQSESWRKAISRHKQLWKVMISKLLMGGSNSK